MVDADRKMKCMRREFLCSQPQHDCDGGNMSLSERFLRPPGEEYLTVQLSCFTDRVSLPV